MMKRIFLILAAMFLMFNYCWANGMNNIGK